MKIILSTFLIACIILISSCYYDKEDLLYGGSNSGPCTDSTGAVSYSQKVVPVFQQLCYSCHNSSFPSGGILMGTYTADKAIGQKRNIVWKYKSFRRVFTNAKRDV